VRGRRQQAAGGREAPAGADDGLSALLGEDRGDLAAAGSSVWRVSAKVYLDLGPT